jgi:hypothetical protein
MAVQFCKVVKGPVSWAVTPCALERALHEQTEGNCNDLEICEYLRVLRYDAV